MQQAILTMGFSPAAAVATWRLGASQQFQCYTYWPTAEVSMVSESYGNQTFQSIPFDLNPASLKQVPNRAFAAVILVVPTIKDVGRMCRRLQPMISKNTVVFVDVSGGIAPVQRLVRNHLGSSTQVAGLICDIDAELRVSEKTWTVNHRGGPAPPQQHALTLEPVGSATAKTLPNLEAAWSSGGLTAIHSKSASAFAELQWQRTITVVAFEIPTVALDIPQPEQLAGSLIAKPILEGLVGELLTVAAACGIKGLPSRSQFVSRGPKLARKAPPSFAVKGASRVYYDVHRNASVALDFLVLLPILLSDELPKGGPTPYLESLYAYTSRLLELTSGSYESQLLQRAGAATGAQSTAHAPVDPAVVAQLEERSRQVEGKHREIEQWHRDVEARSRDIVAKESDLSARESRYAQVLEDLRLQQQQHADRVSQFENDWAQQQRQGQSFSDLQVREEQVAEAERRALQRDREREREFRQREYALANREQVLLAREKEQGSRVTTPPGVGSNQTQQTMGPPTTPGGTVYSRFDPKAPLPPQPAPQSAASSVYGAVMTSPQTSSAGPDFMYARNGRPRGPPQGPPQGQMPMDRRGSRPLMSPQAAQIPFSPSAPNAQGFMTPVQPNGMGPRPRRQSRNQSSAGEDLDQMGLGRRRQSSVNNINSFSQNFQLDSVMGSATDRYHFVSRAKSKQRDYKLSSDEEAYQQKRKFLHGGAQGTAPAAYGDISSSSLPGSVSGLADVSRGYAGDISSASAVPTVSSKRHSVGRPMIPSTIVASGSLNDFGGFNFNDAMDGGSNGSAGSHNNSSSGGSNITPSRSQSGTPPTPHASTEIHTSKWNPETVPFNFT